MGTEKYEKHPHFELLSNEDIKKICMLWLNRIDLCLKEAELLQDHSLYYGACARYYYAMFHTIQISLYINREDYMKHTGVISGFRRLYIKSGIFDTKFSAFITKLWSMRELVDYSFNYECDSNDAEAACDMARKFCDVVGKYVLNRLYMGNIKPMALS